MARVFENDKSFIIMSPKVSILTVTRNRASLLHRCIESVQRQTFKDYEHLIVDGASTDNTEDVVKSYNDPHIRYIRLETNLSLRDTWGIALAEYKGQYLTFLDDDDEYLPTKLEKQVSLMDSLPEDYGMVYCWMDYYDSDSLKLVNTHKPSLRGYVVADAVEKEQVCGTPTLLLRKGVWEECVRAAKPTAIASDWLSGARICRKYKVDFVPEVLVKVYVNHGFTRMSDSGYYNELLNKQIQFHLFFLEEFKDVFNQYPKKTALHMQMLAKNYFLLGNWKVGFKYYKDLIKVRPDFKTFALLPFVIIKNIQKLWTSK